MADNETPIAVPQQTGDAEAALASAVTATGQSANQHVEPGQTTEPAADATAAPAEPTAPATGSGAPRPLGEVVATY